MTGLSWRPWPRRLSGQLLLTIALSLLLAQGINAALLYRAQRSQFQSQVSNALAVRLITASERLERAGNDPGFRLRRARLYDANPLPAEARRLPGVAERLGDLLSAYGLPHQAIEVAVVPPRGGPWQRSRMRRDQPMLDPRQGLHFAVAAMQRSDGSWLVTRVTVPPRGGRISAVLVFQTLVLFLVLIVPAALLTRRLSRSLGTLRQGVAAFEQNQESEPLAVRGPEDVAALTTAFNRMSARIGAMLNEKDVMLGAIGHDLKTPLAALRIRVEMVADDELRARMVEGIDELNRTLDDILTFARLGRSAEPAEPVNLTALVAMLAEEQRDLGADVSAEEAPRTVVPLRLTLIRRALRNLIGNAVRYGQRARLRIERAADQVHVLIEDDGPGIAEKDMERLFEPFARLEPSRSSATGGTGLGLTLARAIAQQHGGSLTLSNRRDAQGAVVGLVARLSLPLGSGS